MVGPPKEALSRARRCAHSRMHSGPGAQCAGACTTSMRFLHSRRARASMHGGMHRRLGLHSQSADTRREPRFVSRCWRTSCRGPWSGLWSGRPRGLLAPRPRQAATTTDHPPQTRGMLLTSHGRTHGRTDRDCLARARRCAHSRLRSGLRAQCARGYTTRAGSCTVGERGDCAQRGCTVAAGCTVGPLVHRRGLRPAFAVCYSAPYELVPGTWDVTLRLLLDRVLSARPADSVRSTRWEQ